ncbi:nucleotidyltransferase family protein [Tranquillimonas rosea]|nr:nucleotidyltransferase family protein [Tranquillimonas rosea]
MRDHPASLMLFAAGFGTRMGALTADRPKPLVEVAGRPLIDHALALTDIGPVRTRVMNVHYRADQLIDHVADRPVTVTHETPDILDTGGGLRNALPALGEGPVFTLNSDAVWSGPNPLSALAAAWDPARMEALLMLVPADRARGHAGTGDFDIDARGRLTRGGPLTYTGAQIIRPDRLSQVKQDVFSLNVIWRQMEAVGTLFGLVHPGGWCDVGHPGGITEAEAMLAESDRV